jgi:hypothetical protein
MVRSRLSITLFLCLFFGGLAAASPVDSYPYFFDNPYLDERMKELMAPHLLPLDHPAKQALDGIFSRSRAIHDKESLLRAGFQIIVAMPLSFVIVARHPAVPGYVFKLYYDTELRSKENKQNCEWLTMRCIGAKKIKKVMREEGIRYFRVPDKWLYVLPQYPAPTGPNPQPVIVMATDMQPTSLHKTKRAWRTVVTKRHLDELYAILKHGYGTTGLVRNILFIREETFAFLDTEYPIRDLNLKEVRQYLSDEMKEYWEELMKKGKK